MKIGRFLKGNRLFLGLVHKNEVYPLPAKKVEDLMAIKRKNFHMLLDSLEEKYPLKEVKFLSPTRPTKIVGVGLNYKSHAEEMGKPVPDEPLIFLKPSTSVISHKMKIFLPSMSKRVDYEGELAVVIGRKCKDVSEEDAKRYILGYSCFNDVTARDLQKKDVQYTRAKGFDTFAPYGPWIQTHVDPMNVEIRTYVNNELKQKGHTSDMIFDVYKLVSFISKIMTLLPGDVIATGTPSGIGPLKKGDIVKIEIDNIGKLVNYVEESREDTERS